MLLDDTVVTAKFIEQITCVYVCSFARFKRKLKPKSINSSIRLMNNHLIHQLYI